MRISAWLPVLWVLLCRSFLAFPYSSSAWHCLDRNIRSVELPPVGNRDSSETAHDRRPGSVSGHWWVYIAFTAVILVLLALDLGVFHRKAHHPSFHEASNVFAILGLRSMYFLLSGAMLRFHLLRYELAVLLIFVGLKMSWLNALWNGHFPTGIALAVIAGVLTASIVLSLIVPPPAKKTV